MKWFVGKKLILVSGYDCLMERNQTRLPTMKEAVEIITMQLSRREQMRQLRFMEKTQGREFAESVRDKVKAANGVRKK